MDRKKLGVLFVAFMTGVILSAGNASAFNPFTEGTSGYILGDPSHGKLVPFFRVGPTLATLIGIETELHEPVAQGIDPITGLPFNFSIIHGDVAVHVFIWSKTSVELINFPLCLSPWDFGFVVIQQGSPDAIQLDELAGDASDPSRSRGIGAFGFGKAKIVTAAELAGNTEGYVTLVEVQEYFSTDGSCSGAPLPISFSPIDVNIATWALLADVGTGFFATEIPTPTAAIHNDPSNLLTFGKVEGLIQNDQVGVIEASLGLIPGPAANPFATVPPTFHGIPGNPLIFGPNNPVWGGNQVLARYDINPRVASRTEIFVWLKRNAFPVPTFPDVTALTRSPSVPGIVYCEDETPLSVTVPLPIEVNVIDVDTTFPGIRAQCGNFLRQWRGVLTFQMPDTGFLFSHITQASEHFRQNYIGYNLDNNGFIDCADDFNDFDESADGLCPGGDETDGGVAATH